jgi:3-hydroxyacyl-[acyl-carrier-protein] dehydratase
MLRNDLYQILTQKPSPNALRAEISLNSDHAIFKGHFPGNPVMPGVCMVHIVRDLTEHTLQAKLRLISADNIKFLAVLDPRQAGPVDVALDFTSIDNRYQVQASLFKEQIVFFKFKGVFEVM